MFNSTLYLGDELTLKSFPMAQPVASEDTWGLYGASPQHILGVGTESTVLSALHNAGRIASRSVGYYWGMDSVGSKDDTPGSLVFGGYDRAKTYGDGDEMDFTLGKDSCRSKMMVSISGLSLNLRNGTDVSLFASSNQQKPLRACIVPQNPYIMSLKREPYFDKLLDAIGSKFVNASKMQGVDYQSALLDPEMPWYDGDFTIKLNTGLSITIPNNQLIVPERRINENGEIYRNDSQPLLRINGMQDGLLSIGRFFFTAAYLATNQDAGKFTIWKANPSTDQDLVALDPNNKPIDSRVTCTATPISTVLAKPDQGDGNDNNNEDEENDRNETDKVSETTTTPATTSTAASTATSTPKPDTGLPIEAQAGIAAGAGAAGLICIGLLAWLIIRRKRRAMGESDAMSLASIQTGWSRSGDMKMAYPSQGYPHFIPQEMGTFNERRPPVEMP
ncbi:uncharacterized protein NECHADRAFT_79911 [Fusarium vanettenii 77-13-4]|uniref:Peptidase A1 domain-containing protein n=1 Tax=Fusarium vanettenii (strain ATCC MYA-4622 / CBS 123669 / FGSC 9596 / NRRL 45880 / 77-13-4) TaxID=660122 RepID=C7Z0J2_FUSV7|nr:uncharacterized protein NECHADRAFT_79911 [Fusarium vanettenii 77-13-4]EEU42215.1 hypothetical protein NECHADRAFT_79911 [Fusarium vanettenii 77-13-4]